MVVFSKYKVWLFVIVIADINSSKRTLRNWTWQIISVKTVKTSKIKFLKCCGTFKGIQEKKSLKQGRSALSRGSEGCEHHVGEGDIGHGQGVAPVEITSAICGPLGSERVIMVATYFGCRNLWAYTVVRCNNQLKSTALNKKNKKQFNLFKNTSVYCPRLETIPCIYLFQYYITLAGF